MEDIPREDEARVAEHQAEQPDDPAGAGIVGEVDDEAGKIDLRLNPRRCLEAHLKPRDHTWPDAAKGSHALADEVHEGRQLARPTDRAGSVGRRLDAALDIFAYGLWIAPRPAGDGGDRYALSMQLQNHHQLSQSNHRRLLARRTWHRWWLGSFRRG